MPQEQLKTIATRNQVYLERYKAGELTKFEQFLVTMANDVNAILARDDITDFTRSRMETLISQVGVMMGRSFDEYHTVWKNSIDELSMYQAGFEARALESVVDGVVFAIPSDSQIMAAIYATPIGVIKGASGGSLLEPFFAGMTQSEIDRVQGAIRLGYAEGQTTAQIMQRVKGTKAAGYTDGIWNETKRNVAAVVRTSLQHAASYARDSVWQENKSVIKAYQWVSTLDSRTSSQCRALDLQVFQFGKGPIPPGHLQCRSSTVAVLKGKYSGLMDDMERSSRDPETGKVKYVSADETYYSWLAKQPAAFQDSVIGPTRGQLMRNGGLSSERFAELQLGKTFEPLTLEQMRKLEPLAFSKAGL